MLYWMIHPSYEAQIRQIWSAPIDAAAMAATQPTASEPLEVINRVAKIKINGVLLPQRNRMLDLFGVPQTSYAEIAAHIREAEGSGDIREIEFQINSPGGVAGNGLVDTAELMARMIKPNHAIVGDLAASAAYWLAAQAQTIMLAGAASSLGSIGVAVDLRVSDNQISIASTDAPRKRPDARTAKGQDDIRRELDAIHELFVAAVARGRGVDADTVNQKFGRGGVLLANAAIDAGMADTLLSAGPPVAPRATIATMNLETLKREHPEVFAAVLALGVQKERDRVSAHLTLATASGDIAAATAHIAEGREVDSVVTAAHTAAHMNRQTEAARVAAAAPPIVPVPPGAPAPAPTVADVNYAGASVEDIAATFQHAGYAPA